MSVLIDFSIFPMDKGERVSSYVARAVSIIRASGLDYLLGPMGTSIEGEWEEVMSTVNRCVSELQKDCSRIYLTIKADYRKGQSGLLSGKVTSVEAKL